MKLIEGQGRVIAAKNIRTELKAAFPNTKFSVTSDSFSGGTSIDISWTDGPLTDEVNSITKKYQYGWFNGMEDIYEYDKDRSFTEKYGSAKYVQTRRELSDEFRASIIKQIEKDYGFPFDPNHFYHSRWGSDLIYVYASKKTEAVA